MRKFTWLLILLLASSGVNSQSFREGFTEANILTEDGYYGLAIPIWLRLLKDNKDNANLNYKIGRCYLSMGLDRDRATPYLKAASKDIRKIYDPFASDFKGAPIETYYYLGKVNHINTKLDSAEYYYQKFLSGSGPKHFLKPEAKLGIEMCKTARELMADSVKVQLSNLGLSVNSSYADYTPIVSLDENTVYFTSRRARTDGSNSEFIENTTGLFFEDMYVSFRNIAGQWMEPELLGINVANKHSSVVSLSPDGQKLYIYKIFNGVGNIYQSDFELGTGWSTPSLVGSNVNSESNEYFATVTADGQRLYFVSDRRGGKGGKDIWYCQLLPNGEWGKAINAGEPINSEKDEDAPYMHPDGKTMFFSSNGHRSMGGYDILFSQKNENNEWSVPQNLGYPINTTDDDYSYVVTPDGKRAYYSSKRKNSIGSADLYLVEYIEPETKQAPIIDMSGFAVLKGWIFAPQGESLPNGIDINIAEKVSQNIVGTAKPVERNGSFVFIIPSGASYNINISLDSTLVYQEAIEVPSGTEYQELAREMFLFGQRENKPQLVAIGDEVLAKALRFRLDAMDLNQPIPLGSRVIYLDGENNAIDTAYVSKNGFLNSKYSHRINDTSYNRW